MLKRLVHVSQRTAAFESERDSERLPRVAISTAANLTKIRTASSSRTRPPGTYSQVEQKTVWLSCSV